MRDGKKQYVRGKNSPLHVRFYLAGAFTLIAGLIGAALIYMTAADDMIAEIAGDKRYEFQLERIGGKAAVFAVEFDQWFGSLWHGKQLAYTVAFLSIGVAIVCFLLARLSLNSSHYQNGNRDV